MPNHGEGIPQTTQNIIMKTRSGFVSNSSSSSFVIITTKEKWNEACAELTKQVGKNMAHVILSEYGEGEKAKVLGKDALVFSGVQSSEEFGCNGITDLEQEHGLSEEEAETLAETAYEHMGELEAILNKDGVSYTSSTSC